MKCCAYLGSSRGEHRASVAFRWPGRRAVLGDATLAADLAAARFFFLGAHLPALIARTKRYTFMTMLVNTMAFDRPLAGATRVERVGIVIPVLYSPF